MKPNTSTIKILIMIIVVMLPNIIHAQPSFTDDVVDAPIDGGLSILIAGGIGYGIKSMRSNKKSDV